jgi:hypothetical protein
MVYFIVKHHLRKHNSAGVWKENAQENVIWNGDIYIQVLDLNIALFIVRWYDWGCF